MMFAAHGNEDMQNANNDLGEAKEHGMPTHANGNQDLYAMTRSFLIDNLLFLCSAQANYERVVYALSL